jgi:RNA polymerase sigma-70 factor (ECF subfamily)
MSAQPPDVPGAAAPAAGAAALAAMRPMLMQLARLQLRNDTWAEDAVSETMLAAVEGMGRFEHKSQLQTWVVGILKNKIVDQFRRNQREISLQAQEAAGDGETLDAMFRADGHRCSAPLEWGDPEEQLARSQFLAVLQACLERLPAPLARAFLLREWLELDTPEVCRQMQISRNNCFVMLHRARARLRACLDLSWFGRQTSSGNG